MKNINKIEPILYGLVFLLLTSRNRQDDWQFTLSIAVIFLIGSLTLPALIRFMTNQKQDTHYK